MTNQNINYILPDSITRDDIQTLICENAKVKIGDAIQGKLELFDTFELSLLSEGYTLIRQNNELVLNDTSLNACCDNLPLDKTSIKKRKKTSRVF